MECIVMDFKNIVSKLEGDKLNLVFLKNRGMFLEDSSSNLFRMDVNKYGSYLDDLIKRGECVSFNHIPKEVSSNIGEWEKEVWTYADVNNFMVRQNLV